MARRHPRPIHIPRPPSDKAVESFWARVSVDIETRCWLWTGGFGQRNHSAGKDGRVRVLDAPGQPLVSAHVLVLTWVKGPRPSPDHHACHTCPDGVQTLCVNPAHLVWATASWNQRDKTCRS